jgi:sporulation protein YlmC with PRC-barrel domain
MKLQLSKAIGTLIFSSNQFPVAILSGIILNPDDGKVVALQIYKKPGLIISPIDIISWKQVIKISDGDVMIPAEEVVRVNKIIEEERQFLDNKVYTKSGMYLGKVKDYSFDTEQLQLKKLYVTKTFLGLVHLASHEIPYKYILEVLEDKIIVKDPDLKVDLKDEETAKTPKEAVA